MSCLSCGACCGAFRVDFDHSEVAGGAMVWAGGVPAAMVVPVVGRTVRMRGTDAGEARCVALEGEIGQAVNCAIYASRPSPCREFAPCAPLGIGDPACARARRKFGLPALPETLHAGAS